MWFLPVFSEDCFGCSGPLAIPYEFEDRTAISHFWKKSCRNFSRDGAEAVDCSGGAPPSSQCSVFRTDVRWLGPVSAAAFSTFSGQMSHLFG